MESYRLRMEAKIVGEAAVRIAKWEPTRGQSEYVGVLAARAAHLANQAAAVECANWDSAGAQRTPEDVMASWIMSDSPQS